MTLLWVSTTKPSEVIGQCGDCGRPFSSGVSCSTTASRRFADPILRSGAEEDRSKISNEEAIAMITLRMHDPLLIAEQWFAAGREIALATVIETWGSAPRPVGSHLLVDGEGNFEGSVSGGCVEGAVVAEALNVIAGGEAKMLEFGIADETAWRVGLSCGGRIRIYVARLGLGSKPNQAVDEFTSS